MHFTNMKDKVLKNTAWFTLNHKKELQFDNRITIECPARVLAI